MINQHSNHCHIHGEVKEINKYKNNNLSIQYTLANPNRGVSIKKKSVPFSEFVRISEVIHLYGEFCSE